MKRRRSRSDGVVQAVRALRSGRRLEQPDLLVVADRPGRQAGLGGDLLDLEEGGVASGVVVVVCGHPPEIPQH